MIRQFAILIIGLFLNFNFFAVSGQDKKDPVPVNDGPYIFYENGRLRAVWIENSTVKEERLNPENYNKIKVKFELLPDYDDLKTSILSKPSSRQNYRSIDSIAVISDIHGEFTSYINLLKAMGIVDSDLNWKFGTGHLVILGDVFDRGDKVTEIFWHLFGLEMQAARAGGMVHFLLGNHEIMTLSKKLNYINEKYRKVEALLNINYSDLYSEESVLGKWLRSKPVIISLDDIMFTHGGISVEMVRQNMNIMKVNQIVSTRIVGKSMSENAGDEAIIFLAGSKGPLWYRGYFEDNNFNEARLDSILNYYMKKHIIVGHTTCDQIESLFNSKIIGVDAGIGIGQPGSMLIYKEGQFYQGTCSGGRTKLQ